jgi:peptidyl-prolyl cis-trans isomerase C
LLAKFKKLAREPLVHFLLIGAGIYGIYGMVGSDDAGSDERVVTITAGEILAMASQWQRAWSRPPTEDELANIIRSRVRIQVLHREALAMGLDKGDTVIEQRLAQKVELLAQNLLTPPEPSEEILIDRYTAGVDRFKQPDLYTVTQIFFDSDKREQTTLDDARAVLEEIEALEELPSHYEGYGDRLMLDNYYPNISERELARLFGTGFAEDVIKLEPGVWHGPVLSGYGTHLVLVTGVVLQPDPPFDDLKEELKREWMAEQVAELSERFVENLMSRYDIVIEEIEVPMTIPGSGASP